MSLQEIGPVAQLELKQDVLLCSQSKCLIQLVKNRSVRFSLSLRGPNCISIKGPDTVEMTS